MTANRRAWIDSGEKEPLMATKLNHEQKGILDDQLFALRAQAADGVRSFGYYRKGLQELMDGKFSLATQPATTSPQRFYPQRDFSRYTQYLRSVSDQLEFLRDINKRMPKALRIPPSWFDIDISAATNHVQTVEHLKSFHVEHDTVAKRWAFAQELVRLTQPAIYDSKFARDARNLQLNRTARRYGSPGLYVVGVNLVDNWDPTKGRSVDQVRTRGQELAATEAIEAYGLQAPELYRSQDGENLPFFDCAGLEQGVGSQCVPYSCWLRSDRGVAFRVSWSGVDGRYASPSLVA